MNVKTFGMVLVSSTVLAGCGGGGATTAENTAPKSTPASAPSTTTPSATTGAGSASTGSLPADYPKDVPVYPGASVVVGSTTGSESGANFNTADAPAKVVAFYQDELAKNGWSKIQPVALAGLNTISATKEKRQLGITITRIGDGKTNITVGITSAQ